MSKKKKKKQKKVKDDSFLNERKRRRNNGKKLLIMLGLFVLFELLYQGLLYAERVYFPLFPVSIYVLFTVLGVLFITYLIMNRGDPKSTVTPNELSSKYPYEKRVELCEKYNKRKEKSKILVYFIVPLSAVLALDFIMLFFLPKGKL